MMKSIASHPRYLGIAAQRAKQNGAMP